MTTHSATNTQTSKTFFQRIRLPLAIIGSSLVILVVFAMSANKPHKKPKVKKIPLVEVLSLHAGDVTFEVETQGSISPRTETTLVSEVSGQIKKVSAKFVVGGFFRKGDQLLEIDPISYQVALLQAQARLDSAKARWVEEQARSEQAEKEWRLTGRSLKNAPILALRKPQLQLALANVKAAQADVKSAQIKLQRTKIKAPYDAMIKSKLVDVGQYVTMGSPLAISFAVDYAEIRLPIKEVDLPYIKIPKIGADLDPLNAALGSQVILSFKQNGQLKAWKTRIIRSEGVVNTISRVHYVVAQIDDPYALLSSDNDHPILPIGSFVRATIIGNTRHQITALPRAALRGADSIYLINKDNRLEVKKISILRSDGDFIYLPDPIAAEKKLILTKLPIAVAGMKLRTSLEDADHSATPTTALKGGDL